MWIYFEDSPFLTQPPFLISPWPKIRNCPVPSFKTSRHFKLLLFKQRCCQALQMSLKVTCSFRNILQGGHLDGNSSERPRFFTTQTVRPNGSGNNVTFQAAKWETLCVLLCTSASLKITFQNVANHNSTKPFYKWVKNCWFWNFDYPKWWTPPIWKGTLDCIILSYIHR